MAENGEEKLVAMARHIAKTLGHTDSMTEEIIHVFSSFDPRCSRDKLSDDISDSGARPPSLDDLLRSVDRRLSSLLASDTPIWSESAAAASSFLSSVDDLLAAIRDWLPFAEDDRSVAASLDRAEDLLQQAMFRLESEFRSLIEQQSGFADAAESIRDQTGYGNDYSSSFSDDDDDDDEEEESIPVALPVTDYNVVIDALPAGTIGDLNEIAKRMVMAEYARECSHVYSACRRDFLVESLSRLGFYSRMTLEEVQRTPWADLEDDIERWTKAAGVALRILFPSERRLCDRVFAGFPSAADLSFMEVCRGPAIQLLSFADAIAFGSRSPERLFRVLDVYETLRDLMPEFDALFSNPYCAALRTEAVAVWKKLGESIRGMFMELENLIRRDPANQAVPGGGVHPITRYVMNYARAACKARETLEQVFEDSAMGLDSAAAPSSSTSLSVQMAWIMELLESNLATKSKIYRDIGLSSIFMMNNGRYIVHKVKDSELGELLGEDWIRKHNAKVKQFSVNYQRSSWNKVLGLLKMDPKIASSAGSFNNEGASPRSLRERLRMFNTCFEETCRAQSTWVVFDDQLKEELKISVAGYLTPAYRNFLGRFQNSAEGGRNADRYIKYSVEDVEARIHTELFQGTAGKRRN